GPVEVGRAGRIGALQVTVVADPNPVELEIPDGETDAEPVEVDVEIEITNPYSEPLDDVVVQVRPPTISSQIAYPVGYRPFSYLVYPPPPLVGDPVEGDPPPIEIET